jgi:putative heme-binding domain-containing protein
VCDDKVESVRIAALAALRSFDQPHIATRVIPMLADATASTRTAALVLLASRPGWALALVEAAERGDITPAWVSADIIRQIQRHKNAPLAQIVSRVWPHSGRPTTAAMDEQIHRIATVLEGGSADPYNGKKLFTANCSACHRLFNLGGAIGPDLTPFRRDDIDSLLLSIVNPSAEVREGYENYLVETRDDRSLNGFVVRQDDRAVVMRGLDGQDLVLQRAEITELRPAEMSLMPEGLLDGLEDQQIRDLFAYVRSSQPLAN